MNEAYVSFIQIKRNKLVKMNKLTLLITAVTLSGNVFANKMIIFPDTPQQINLAKPTVNSSNDINNVLANKMIIFPVTPPQINLAEPTANSSKDIKLHPFDLAKDDLGNRVRTIALSTSIDAELIAELQAIGLEQGFNVSTQDSISKWTEDNMWLSRDGSKVYRPEKTIQGSEKSRFHRFITGMDKQSLQAIQAIQEGYHSLGYHASQGLPLSELSRADTYAANNNSTLVKTFSIVDGGNMLTGQRKDGSPYVLVGRDAILQTALRHMDSDNERFEAKKQQMENDNGFVLSITKPRTLDIYMQRNNDPEIDRLLLESANLLPVDLTLLEQVEYVKLLRAKSEIFYASSAERALAENGMNLASVKQRILNRYIELYGSALPVKFDLDRHLKNSYTSLITMINKESEFNLSLIDEKLKTLSPDNITEEHLASMLQAGNYIRTGLPLKEAQLQGRRFIAMMKISEEKMAEELGIDPENLIIIAQPGFHIDMHLRPLENGKVLINDYQFSQFLVQHILDNDGTLTTLARKDLKGTLIKLKEDELKFGPINQLISKQLTDAGLTPVKTAGVFQVGQRYINWMNGIMGTGKSKFYVTNAASIPSLNQAFSIWLQHQVPGIAVHFVGHSRSTSWTSDYLLEKFGYPLNQAEILLRSFGGLDCISIHFE